MGAVVELEALTPPERRLLLELRGDGAPVAIIGGGYRRHWGARALHARGLLAIWPGRGWYLTDAGLAARDQLIDPPERAA